MSEKVEPALTAEEWSALRHGKMIDRLLDGLTRDGGVFVNGEYVIEGSHIPAAIALLNHALPESDPRKITRAKVDAVRHVANTIRAAIAQSGEEVLAQRALDFADALESYLPPDGP